MPEEKQKEAGVISMLASLFIPLYGIIYYVIKRNEVKNASTCLWIAIVSIILECIYGMWYRRVLIATVLTDLIDGVVWQIGFSLLPVCVVLLIIVIRTRLKTTSGAASQKRGGTDGIMDSMWRCVRCDLGWGAKACTTACATVVPRRCAVCHSGLSDVRCAVWVSRPPTVVAATAIAWWRCSGCHVVGRIDVS